jgi:hypothetical protein
VRRTRPTSPTSGGLRWPMGMKACCSIWYQPGG